MAQSDEEKIISELEKGFAMLAKDPMAEAHYEEMKKEELEWKRRDPEGYKKDMEKLCRDMFGDRWEIEYRAMLKEEFPEEFEDQEQR